MTEQWQELKETITEMRDNDGTGTQQEVCKFLANYMDVLEKQMQEPQESEKALDTEGVLDKIKAEIASLDTIMLNDNPKKVSAYVKLSDVREVIDKYR